MEADRERGRAAEALEEAVQAAMEEEAQDDAEEEALEQQHEDPEAREEARAELMAFLDGEEEREELGARQVAAGPDPRLTAPSLVLRSASSGATLSRPPPAGPAVAPW